MYTDDDMLILSGIQHFRFCPRQWALMEIDRQWADNRLTIEGQQLHERVDDPFYRQKCGDAICLRAVHVASRALGLYGVADVIELHRADADDPDTIAHPKYPGRWRPVPVEYKHGRPKRGEEDKVQLAAQAMALEEMHGISITRGAFFYGETRRRVDVDIDDRLRQITRQCAGQMHEMLREAAVPEAEYRKRCDKCSLLQRCLPQAPGRQQVEEYLEKNLRS